MKFLPAILCCLSLLLVQAGSAQETKPATEPPTQEVPANAPPIPGAQAEPEKVGAAPSAQPAPVTKDPAAPQAQLKPLTYILLAISLAIGPILIIWLFRKNKR